VNPNRTFPAAQEAALGPSSRAAATRLAHRFRGSASARLRRVVAILGLVGVALAGSGCAAFGIGGASDSRGGPRVGASDPALTLSRFLEAANTGDVEAMARLYGNASGTVAETVGGAVECGVRSIGERLRLSAPCVRWTEVEAQMGVVAALLQHDTHRIRAPTPVPGGRSPSIRYDVELIRGAERTAPIPVLVVQSPRGGWVVRSIPLDTLTPRVW
jgi:hypothetical protein